MKEIKNMKTLKCQNIVEYMDSWVDKGKKEFIFIIELMNGGTLKQYF